MYIIVSEIPVWSALDGFLDFMPSNMAISKQSLLNFLRVANPALSCQCPGGSTTTQGSSPWREPDWIAPWTDFNFESLQTIYDGVLSQILDSPYDDLHDHPFVAETPFCEIFDEQCLEKLLAKWTQSIVCEALQKAQVNNMSWPTNSPVDMVSGGAAKFEMADRVKGRKKRYQPDWAGILRKPNTRKKFPNILPGETKPSSKWNYKKLPPSRDDPVPTEPQFIKPIQQLYTYCVRSASRYGYLITDRELLVVRVGLVETLEASKKRGYLEYKLIPWRNDSGATPNDANDLTVNLALFFLYMLVPAGTDIQHTYEPLGKLVKRDQPLTGENESVGNVEMEKGKMKNKDVNREEARTKKMEIEETESEQTESEHLDSDASFDGWEENPRNPQTPQNIQGSFNDSFVSGGRRDLEEFTFHGREDSPSLGRGRSTRKRPREEAKEDKNEAQRRKNRPRRAKRD